MPNGKLVVLEGTDGSGKATQLRLATDALTKQNVPTASLDFPQYDKTFFGKLAGRMMAGEFGSVENLPAPLVSLPYAADRWQAKESLLQSLTEGKVVVSNRYATSSVYQAALVSKEKRQEFLDWAWEMEYNVFGMPKEDLVLFLYVPVTQAQKLIEQRGIQKDTYEGNSALMQEIESLYLSLCARFEHWVKIACTKGDTMRPKEEIHEEIMGVLREKKIIP